MMQVKDLTVGSFEGAITLVYEDKPANNETVDILKSKKVFEGKSGQVFYKTTNDLNYEIFVGLGRFDELEKVDLIMFAESLGGTETLITYPLTQTHNSVPEEIREKLGITGRLLRLSVGIEDANDIIKDLENAMK